jgi:hypothetical protein
MTIYASIVALAFVSAAIPEVTLQGFVQRLGSGDYRERRSANDALEAAGGAALKFLRQRLARPTDLETRRRIENLVQSIENRPDGLLVDYKGLGLPSPAWESIDSDHDVQPDVLVGLALAIQCEQQGWHFFAKLVLRRTLKASALDSPHAELIGMAWSYWERQLRKRNADWHSIYDRLANLAEHQKPFLTAEREHLLVSLRAALKPSRSAKGSVSALIDRLVDCTSMDIGYSETTDPCYLALVSRGFDAVPELIAHLSDDRLTRTRWRAGVGTGLPFRFQCRVGHIVASILEELADKEIKRAYSEFVPVVDRAKALAWWEGARRCGEEAYIGRLIYRGSHAYLNSFLLRVLAAKYPHNLPKLYREILKDFPRCETWQLAQAISDSTLPPEQQFEILLCAMNHDYTEHVRAATSAFKAFWRREYDPLLTSQIRSSAGKASGLYWNCPDGVLACLASCSDSPAVWKALTDLAKRADVGTRMEILSRGQTSGARARQRLELLRGFLDDSTVRDEATDPERFIGSYAGCAFPRLEVRNFVALEIAESLKLSIEKPEKGSTPWTDQQWTAFRRAVREALTLLQKRKNMQATK